MKSNEPERILALMDALPECGDDLEYDADFLALQQALMGKLEQQFGATIIPAEAPDWRAVERLAAALCERTCDLRVLAPLTRAWTEARGLVGYVEGLQVIDTVLARQWPLVHPRVVFEDGEEDPLPRVNALATIADPAGLGRCVREARLLEEGGVTISLRVAETILDPSRTEQLDFPGGVTRLRESLARAFNQGSPALQALSESLALLQRIRGHAERELGQSWAPDFTRLERTLRAVVKLLPEISVTTPPDSNATVSDVSVAAEDQKSPIVEDQARSGKRTYGLDEICIEGRDDVRLVLEKVCQYLERSEPSHPSPILIRRAQRLLDLNFLQIIEELVPEGVEKVQSLAGASTPRES